MAKAKSGGTRSYLRGRVGADVYSIGKDGNGKKQQIVRSLAETVANPRTQAQMVNRMVMSTVMQAVSGLSQLIDHSFDGVANGQPSISEFIRRNYALVKDSVDLNSVAATDFELVDYGAKIARPGKYVISTGKAVLPAAVTARSSALNIAIGAATTTVGALKSLLGIGAGEYLTYVTVAGGLGARFFRVYLNELPDDTVVNSTSVASVFTVVGNVTPDVFILGEGENAQIVFEANVAPDGEREAIGIIISKLVNGQWEHNDCTLGFSGSQSHGAAAALPTYPTGEERFLNGGEL